MAVRRFNGTSDFIKTGIGSCSWTFGSFGALFRLISMPGSGGFLFSNHTSAGTFQAGIRLTFGGLPFLSGSWSADHQGTTALVKETWYILVITKATGTATPRLHIGKWNGSSFVWTHENESGTETNSPAQTSGSIYIGSRKGAEFVNADFAAIIEWPSVVLSDAEVEGLGTQTSLKTGWKEYKSPAGLITFEQGSVSEEVQDIIGGADQTERSGTTVVSEEPPIPYVVEESKTVELAGSVASSSSLSGKLNAVRALKGSLSGSTSLAGLLRALRVLKGSLTSASSLSGTLEVDSEELIGPPLRIREYPRTDLHYEIETPNGRFYRWGRDEPRPENVPSGGGFSSTAPGGFDSIGLTLPRKPGVDYSDLRRLSTLRALGSGGEIACEARFKEAPRVSGDQMSVSPVTEGWIAHLQDDTTAAEIYIDRDLSAWRGPSNGRLDFLSAGNLPGTGSGEVTTELTGVPVLRLHVDGVWTTAVPCAEMWYDAGPAARIAGVGYSFASLASTSWILEWGSSESETEFGQSSGDIFTAAEASGALAAPNALRRFFAWHWRFNATNNGIDAVEFAIALRELAVFGTSNLSTYGSGSGLGVLASDVVADAVSRWAPALNYTTGSSGSIRPTSTIIPHLVFKEKTAPLAFVEGANAFEGRIYGVWDNKTFHYYNWGDVGRKWRARVGPTELTETGPTTERLRNGVIVQFSDVDGITKTAGPLNSGCDFTSSLLEDKDPENPANQRGLKMYGPPIDIGQSTSYSGAEVPIGVGVRILEVLKETDRSGTAKIVGFCEDANGVVHPSWKVRAGDQITFVDSSEPVERRIIRADYDESSLTCSITLDAPAEDVPALLAQMGVSIADLGI